MATLDSLKKSRKGLKSALTRVRNAAVLAIDNHTEGEDPSILEAHIRVWQERLQKFQDAEDKVMCHTDSIDGDTDKDIGEHEDKFLQSQVQVTGYRRDFDADNAVQPPAPNPNANQNNQGQAQLPKFEAKKPPTLNEDIDHRAFIRWRPLWQNYSNLISLTRRPREVQVGIFWECCSPGFLRIVNHGLGIKADTGRTVVEIMDIVERHLRSLRSQHLDMRDLLAVRQRDHQDYTSLCNELRELADYASTHNITEDRLLIALLLQAMKNESDKAKVMERNPTTFENARTYILELETARKGAKAISSSSSAASIATNKTKSSYKKNNKSFDSNKSSDSAKSSKPKSGETCNYCGRSLHPRDQCPAKDSSCQSCGKTGHWHTVCKSSKPNQSKKSAAVKTLRISSLRETPAVISTAKNNIDVLIKPKHSSQEFKVNCIADTGADVNVMGVNVARQIGLLNKTSLNPPLDGIKILGVNDKPLQQYATFQANFRIKKNVAKNFTMILCPRLNQTYISLDVCKALNIVSQEFPQPKTVAAAKTSSDLLWSKTQRNDWIRSLPSDPTQKDFDAVTKKLKDVYSSVFDAKVDLKPMKGPVIGEPMAISLKEDAKPFAIHTARQIPFALRDQIKQELDDMVAKNILAPVGDVPTKWCHPLVVVPKPGGAVRLCVDLTRLNSEVVRTAHPIKTPMEAVSNLKPNAKFFAKFDLTKGYWQMPLAKESQELTTFITPFGKYKYLRCPMGFVSTGDSYSWRGDLALAGLPVQKVIDDIAGAEETFHDLVQLVCDVLERCHQHDLTVNGSKSIFCARSIDFVGYKLSENRIEADPKKLEAIQKFPVPANLTDLRSFLGLVNQLGNFSSQISAAAGPLRDLLKTRNAFLWLPEHSIAFEKVKEVLTSPACLAQYHPDAELLLQTDASRLNGLGFALLQLQDGEWRLLQCGSRFLRDAETRYAMVELEALAIYWAIKKCHLYLAGIPHFQVNTDHYPLKSIFNNQTLDAVENPRVQNYKSKLMSYNFTVDWIKGKDHAIPDALSRAPVCDPESDDLHEDTDELPLRIASIQTKGTDIILDDLQEAAKSCKQYISLRQAVLSGTVSKAKSGYISLFKKLADQLSVDDNLVLRGNQIIVPFSAVKDVLKILHASHQGIEKTKRRARQTVYWPGYTSDIKNMVEACQECAYYKPSHVQEPMIQEDNPTRPFEIVSADLFSFGGHEYLIYTDRLSGFPFVSRYTTSPSASVVIKDLRKYFCLMGVPNFMRSDGGPQFKAEITQSFLKHWGVQWKPSSPGYPQSNGHAECSVKLMKHLLAKTGGKIDSPEFLEGLLEFRNSPRADGHSPAQILFGRALRSRLPASSKLYKPNFQLYADAIDQKELLSAARKINYDKQSRNLPHLKAGDRVVVQDFQSNRWCISATVVKREGLRRYLVRCPSGRILVRNRRFLRSAPLEQTQEETSYNENQDRSSSNESPKMRRSKRARKSPNRLQYV